MGKQEEENKVKTKKEKGITLIALVITIIVLLILAAVSIATLTGQNGILSRADDAKRENEIASVKEQARLDISNYVAEKLINGEDSTVNTPEKVQEILDGANAEENRYYAGYTETGVKTPNGYEVPYEELYTTGSSGEGTTSKTVEDLVVGDKVYYDTGNTSIGDKGIIECTVLYDKAYNEENGTNYGVQIISKDIVDTVTLGSNNFDTSMNSYNNAITSLNAKAEEYRNAIYASDARCVGSVPNNKNAESGNFNSEYDYMLSYTFRDTDTNYETDYNQMQTLGITTANSNYWLASRCVFSYSYVSYFLVRHVDPSGTLINNNTLCDVKPDGYELGISNSYGFRPVFTLKFEIKVIEGDGKDTPYTLAP